MPEFLEIINIVGILGTIVISTTTLFTTRALQRSQQKATIMATKRSERIDLMREYSAKLISSAKKVLYGIANTETVSDLISYADQFISLLQYEYQHDVDLIDCAKSIVDVCICDTPCKSELDTLIDSFWKMCDIYVGVEYERLKNESMGDIKASGEVKGETKTFEEIYSILANHQDEFISSKK